MAETKALPLNLEEYNSLSFIKISYRLYEERLWGVTLPEDPIEAEVVFRELQEREFKVDENGNLPIYRGEMICTSKRSIPKNLTYLGNYPSVTPPENEYVPYGEHWTHGKKYNTGLYSIKWKDIVDKVCKKAKI